MTRIYGRSDDLIEFDGDVYGEVGYGGRPDEDGQVPGDFVFCSDGTMLRVKYGKEGNEGVWGIVVIHAGSLFDRLEQCFDEDADPYSDVAHFHSGLKRAYVARAVRRAE